MRIHDDMDPRVDVSSKKHGSCKNGYEEWRRKTIYITKSLLLFEQKPPDDKNAGVVVDVQKWKLAIVLLQDNEDSVEQIQILGNIVYIDEPLNRSIILRVEPKGIRPVPTARQKAQPNISAQQHLHRIVDHHDLLQFELLIFSFAVHNKKSVKIRSDATSEKVNGSLQGKNDDEIDHNRAEHQLPSGSLVAQLRRQGYICQKIHFKSVPEKTKWVRARSWAGAKQTKPGTTIMRHAWPQENYWNNLAPAHPPLPPNHGVEKSETKSEETIALCFYQTAIWVESGAAKTTMPPT